MRKKISSLFLAFTLIITAFPTYAFASVEGVSVSEEGYVTSLDVSAPVGTSVFYEEGENGKFYLRQGDENSTNWNEDMTIGFSESVHKYFILCNNSTTGEIPISFKTNKDVTATCKIGSSEEKNVEISPDGIGTVTITAAEKKDADLVGQKTCKVELTFSKDDSSQTYELNFYRKGPAAKITGLLINGEKPAGYDEKNTSELNVAVENQFSIYVGSYVGPTHKISVYKEDNNIKTLITEKSFSMKDRTLSIDELDAGKYYIKYSNIEKGIVKYTHTLVINCIDNSPRKVNISIKNRETNEIISDALIKIFDSNKAEIQPDNDGYKLRPGKYTYVVKGKGYFTEQGDFLVDKNDRNIDVFMISSGEHKSSNVIERFYGEYYHAGTSDSGEEWTATQYENTDVYFTNIEKISTAGLDYTINGTLASPTAMVTLVNAKGTSYPVSYSIKEGKRVFQSKIDFFAAGAQHFSISVSDDDTELRTYDLILNMPISNNSILEGLMLHNATDNSFLQTDNQPKNLITDNCFIKKSIVDTNQISLQLKRNGSDPKFDLLWSLGTWFSNDENWVRINNGDWSRATASANVSPSSNVLNLKKGLNIVDVWSEAAEVPYKLLNKHEEESDVGIPKRNARECETEFTTLLLYNQGDDSKENDLSSDLSIKDITAKQWIAKRVIEIDEFPVQREDGQYKVFLPETLYFPYIVLTIYPENPSDKIEVEGAIGERIGYNFVIPVKDKDKDKNKIQVKLSDSEGKTKIHTIDIVRKSSAAFIEELDVDNAELNKSFVKEQYNYELKPSQVNDEKITLKPILSEGSTLKVNGIRVSDNSVLIDRSTPKTVLEITAADGVTKNKYIFLLESGKISSTIIEKANSILAKGWMKDAAVEKAHYGNYWSVFQAAATGIDMHNSTFDVKPLNECKQATDYGATILQLVLMGENPYNYKGANYVEALAKDDTHTYANDIFRLMAFTAAGYDYDDALVERITKMSKSKSFDLDMKSWALIAVSPLLDKADLVAIADTFKDKLQHTGKDTGMFVGDYGANANTQGCVISALVSAGVDIGSAEWTINGINPLDVMEKYYVREDGKIYYINPENKPDYWTSVEYGYNKDFIIALGDIIAGSNVWQREALTRSKYNSLLCKAEQMIIKAEGTDKQRAYLEKKYNIAKDLIKDKNQNEIKGFGKTYYDLYEAMSFIDESMKLTDPTAVKVKSVSVNGNLKSEYQLNETFDPSEINFTIEYEDGTSEILTYDQVNIVGFDTNTSGKKPIRFEYKGKYSDVHYITVMAKGETPDQTDNAYITVKDPTGKTYVNKKTIRIEDGETAYSLLTKTGLNVSCKNSIYGLYVEGIEGLYEFDKGVGSGWMYCVNGVFPNYSSELYKIKQNDTVEWLYTTNYGVDIGAGGNFTPEVNKDVTTSGGAGSATTMAPTEVKVSGSTATATIKAENQSEILKQAVDKKSAEIILEVSKTDTKGADSVQLSLEVSFVKKISDKTDANLTVNTENGKVTLDQETIKTVLAEAKGATITLEVTKVAKPTEAQKKAAGTNGHLLKLTIKSGDKVISDFNKGKVKVVAEIVSKLLDKKVAAIHIADDGKIEQLAGKILTIGGKKYYEFTTPHFSTFALVDADELGLEVNDEEANIVKIKELISDMSLKARSSKTSKKNIKVTLTVDKSTAAAIKEIEDMGYTVKYKYYRSTKKASKYQAKIIKTTKTFTNTAGKKGTRYYYKARIQVYDKDGKLVAQTALKQCKYAVRTWTK